MDLPYLLFSAIICGLIGYAIGNARGRPGAGFFWGAFLGPLGWLVLLVGPNYKKDKETAELKAREEKLQASHLAELKALREMIQNAPKKGNAVEDLFWVRIGSKEIGPISRPDLLDLYAAKKITLETEVALEKEGNDRQYRSLGDEVPILRRI